jgi:hypothetical protein
VEFDRPRTHRSARPFDSAWDLAFPFFSVANLLNPPSDPSTLARMLGVLLDSSDDAESAASECLEGLPRRTRLLHVSALTHRGSRDVRVQASAPRESVDDWLSKTRDASRGASVLGRLLHELPINVFGVQATRSDSGVRPHSVEITFPHGSHGDPVWRTLLSRAIDIGVASRDKVEALLRWPGHHVALFPGFDVRIRIDRCFHVTLRVDGEPQLKGYVYLCPQYVLN